MAFIDYYKILGVDKNIPQKDVRAAYRKRAKLFHPDLHPNDPKAKAKFQALKYDQYGEKWQQADAFQGQAGGNAAGNPFEGFDFSGYGEGGGGFSSFFQDLFGGGAHFRSSGFNYGTQSRPDSGQMEAKVNIDLYTALLGGEIMIQLSNGQKLKLKVKPETQNGTKVRVRGKGYNRGDGTFGDLIINYQVKLPTGLNERQKQLLREMQQA